MAAKNGAASVEEIAAILDGIGEQLAFDPTETRSQLCLGLVNRASAYDDCGQYDLAIVDLQKALELDPDYVKAHNLLACIELKRGNPMEALVHVQTALGLSPNDPYCLGTAAEAHSKLGNRPMFYKYFRQALELDAEQMDLLDEQVYLHHKDEQQFQQILLEYPRN